jgi:hypothetical protein
MKSKDSDKNKITIPGVSKAFPPLGKGGKKPGGGAPPMAPKKNFKQRGGGK